MNGKTLFLCLLWLTLAAASAPAQDLAGFSPLTGNWRGGADDGQTVLIVDGGDVKPGGKERFPAAVYTPVKNFTGGEIRVRLKPLAGRIDQAGGILFDLKENGDYLVIRANALENNVSLYRYAKGKRTPLEEISGAFTQKGAWQELKLIVVGGKVTGYLNGKRQLEYALPGPVSGGVGLWSKDDSVTAFADFTVKPDKPAPGGGRNERP